MKPSSEIFATDPARGDAAAASVRVALATMTTLAAQIPSSSSFQSAALAKEIARLTQLIVYRPRPDAEASGDSTRFGGSEGGDGGLESNPPQRAG